MRILLNVTERELGKVSGDVSYYRDLLAADTNGPHEYVLVDARAEPFRQPPKVFERLAARMPDSAARRKVFQFARRRTVAPPFGSADFDVILSHITMPPLSRCGAPIIWSSQGLSPPEYYDRVGPVGFHDVIDLYERYSREAAALLIWTESGARRLREMAKIYAPVVVLPPVLPRRTVEQPLARRAAGPHLLFVGRDAARKGLFELVAALERLSSKLREVAIDIVSAPPRDLATRIEALPGAILHDNPSDDMVAALMERADLLALPTLAETYGYVLVEAMAQGCALLTTDSPPMNELVIDGENGFVVSPGDSLAIERRLHALLNDPETLARMGDASRARYEAEFAPEPALARYYSLYEAVASGQPLSV